MDLPILLNKSKRASIIWDDTLQVYLPLYHPDLKGSPFVSFDQNHISCTVTGATYGSTGRTFDGNDYISLTSPFAAGEAFTIMAWFKQTTRQDTRIIVVNLTQGDGTKQGLGIGIEAATNNLIVFHDGVSEGSLSFLPDLDTWYFAMMTRSGNVSKLYKDGDSTVISTLDAALEDSGTEIHLGKGIQASGNADYYLKGVIGEVLIYDHVLTAADWNTIYQATRWRYGV